MPHKDPEASRAYFKAYRERNSAKILEKRKLWLIKNPEKVRAQRKAFRLRHPEKMRAKSRREHAKHKAQRNAVSLAYRAAHLDERLAYDRLWRATHQEEEKARHHAYRIAHPEIKRLASARRRAQKKQAARNDFTAEQEALVLASHKGVCDYCIHYNPDCKACKKGTHILTIDHITAIANKGDNTLWNVTACCRSCNAKKWKNPPPVPVQPLLL